MCTSLIFKDNPALILSNADVLRDTYRAPLLHTPGARMRCVELERGQNDKQTNEVYRRVPDGSEAPHGRCSSSQSDTAEV